MRSTTIVNLSTPQRNRPTFAYSGRCRLRVVYRGSMPVSWELQYLDGDNWVPDTEVGRLFFPFWRDRRKVYLRNPDLLKDPESD